MSEPVWMAPDARVDDLVAPAPPPVPAAPSRTEEATPELPVPLRPMNGGDRLDGALRALRIAPRTVVTLAALAVVPVQLLSVLLLPGPADPGQATWEPMLGRAMVTILADDDPSRVLRGFVLLAIESLALSFVAAGLTVLIGGWYTGIRRSTAEVVAAAARRLPALAVAWLVVHAVEVASSLLFVLTALLPMALFSVVAPVVGAEGAGPLTAVRRSFRLTKRTLPLVLGTCLTVALVDVTLRGLLTVVAAAYAESELPARRAAVVLVAMAVRLLTVPFVAGSAALLYLDLRVRLEGLDIELAAQERFPVASP